MTTGNLKLKWGWLPGPQIPESWASWRWGCGASATASLGAVGCTPCQRHWIEEKWRRIRTEGKSWTGQALPWAQALDWATHTHTHTHTHKPCLNPLSDSTRRQALLSSLPFYRKGSQDLETAHDLLRVTERVHEGIGVWTWVGFLTTLHCLPITHHHLPSLGLSFPCL